MKITIVGTGYVGLVTGACFSEVGIDVTCVDVDANKIENLKNGILPIWEPSLEDMVLRNVENGRLHFSTDLAGSLEGTEVVFSAVGTPPDEDGSADLKYVLQVAKEVGQHMNDYVLIVTKSTVPVGTAEKVKKAIQFELDKRGVLVKFDVASNPEFLKEGDAVNDFLKPDRIVIGCDSERAKRTMERLYKPFVLNGHPVIFMDITSAEMTKYAANSMLATKISFMNDIANLCEIVGADVNAVRKGIGSDTRIGNKFIYPGTGYGGSCFPKDVKALIKTADDYSYNMRVLKAVEEVNENQKSILFNKLNKHFNYELKGKHIALWGLSFKPQTDDMRDAPSLIVIQKLIEAGATVKAYDPVAMNEAKHMLGDKIMYAEDKFDALLNADALIVVTEWPEFKFLNYDQISQLMNNNLILDGRNIYDAKEMKENDFTYYCIGVDTSK